MNRVITFFFFSVVSLAAESTQYSNTTLVVAINETALATEQTRANFAALQAHFKNAPEATSEPAKLDLITRYPASIEEDIKNFEKLLEEERRWLVDLCRDYHLRVVLHTNANLRKRQYEVCDGSSNYQRLVSQSLKWKDFESTKHFDFLIENQPLLSQEVFQKILLEGQLKDHEKFLIVKSHGGFAEVEESLVYGDLRYLVGKLLLDVRKMEAKEARSLFIRGVEDKLLRPALIRELRKLPELSQFDFEKSSHEGLLRKIWSLKEFPLKNILALKGENAVLENYLTGGFQTPVESGVKKENRYGMHPIAFEGAVVNQFKATLVHSCFSLVPVTRGSRSMPYSGPLFAHPSLAKADAVAHSLEALHTGLEHDDFFFAFLQATWPAVNPFGKTGDELWEEIGNEENEDRQ